MFPRANFFIETTWLKRMANLWNNFFSLWGFLLITKCVQHAIDFFNLKWAETDFLAEATYFLGNQFGNLASHSQGSFDNPAWNSGDSFGNPALNFLDSFGNLALNYLVSFGSPALNTVEYFGNPVLNYFDSFGNLALNCVYSFGNSWHRRDPLCALLQCLPVPWIESYSN